ncbi:MAG TPA: response regulator [Thermoleophilia bacterium]|nr:response regulator [Thermoleophilia bacterium]
MARILIVDDDPDILDMGRVVLGREGHEVLLASNRAGGMKMVTEEHPDLLVLDVMMEVIDDGFVMARELRQQGNTVPILILTSINAATGMKFAVDPVLAPVDDLQEKPLYPKDLIDRVNRLLAARDASPA